jgi:hypothetical protein
LPDVSALTVPAVASSTSATDVSSYELTILLEPLSEREAGALIEKVGSGTDLSESALRGIAEASEGNPLFVEQMLAFQAEDGGPDEELVLPPTIQALLAARIDRLSWTDSEMCRRLRLISLASSCWHRRRCRRGCCRG